MTTDKANTAEQIRATPDGAERGQPAPPTPTAADGAALGASIIAREEQRTREAIASALADLGYESASNRPIDLRPLPFEGTWGAASTVARALAGEAVTRELEESGALEGLSKKEAKKRINELIPAKAQEIAAAIAGHLLSDEQLSLANVEAVNGYVNIYFDASAMAMRLIGEVLSAADDYGQGAPRSEVVMIEHSQPNTHKAFHVGHLRNTSLGVALSHIISKAGYGVLDATYIGDIGRHVIQCLWCYEQFYRG
jgi:arginyl-tRNA synthetase